MRQNFSISKIIHYLVSGIGIILGGVILTFGCASMETVTQDPNIGEGLTLLLGYFLIILGLAVSLAAALVRKFKCSK
ncbi:hypothetical protein D9M70_652880 [compost metagenome]